jgi:hypothetical protein
VKILYSEENLGSIKLGPVLAELLFLFDPGEHFPSSVVLHDEEYFFPCLEGKLDIDKERVVD